MSGPITIELAGEFSLRHRRIERLIGVLTPLWRLETATTVSVDLSRLVHMSPAALALFAATLRRVEERRLLASASTLILPRARGVRGYLERMNVITVGGGGFGAQLGQLSPTGSQPLARFRTDQDYPAVAERLTRFVAEQAITDEIARASLRIALDEIAENVVQHAGAPTGGFAVAQRWLKNHRLEIAVADLGMGILSSLRQNPRLGHIDSDVHAIRLALQPHVSATPQRNSGIGLFITRLLLEANGGLLFVRSGHGLAEAGARASEATLDLALPGTLIAIRVCTDRPLDIDSVYLQLDDEQRDDD